MKTIVLSLVLLCASTLVASAKIDPARYSFPSGYERVIAARFYSGYSTNYALSQIMKDSKEVTATAKGIKYPYFSVEVTEDGAPMKVDATPKVGARVLELNGVYWFNVETGQLLIQDAPLTQSSPYAYANGQSRTEKRERDGQGLAIAVGVLQQAAPMVLNRIGNRQGGYGYSGGQYRTGSGVVQTVNMSF